MTCEPSGRKRKTSIARSPAAESALCADGAKCHEGIARRRRTVNHFMKKYVDGIARADGIESVLPILKKDPNSVYRNWSKKRRRQHVDKFAFQLNEGNCGRDTQSRLDGLLRALVGKTLACGALAALWHKMIRLARFGKTFTCGALAA